MAQARNFPSPHEIPPIPGTEGWEEMYSYYHLFNGADPERAAFENAQLWYRGSIHLPDPVYPLDANLSCDLMYGAISALANRAFQVPVMKGFDYRILNGHIYLNSIEVEDPEEIGQRMGVFKPRIGAILHDWPNFYAAVFEESDKLVDELKALDFSNLIELESDEAMKDLLHLYPMTQVYRDYLKMWDILVRMGQHTLKALLPSYAGYLVYMDNMRTLFPGIPDKALTQMVQGFESRLFRPVEELQNLAQGAVELGVTGPLLDLPRWAQAKAALEQTENGRAWLERFEAARDPWFEMTNGEGWQKQSLSWNDDLDVPLVSIRNYIISLQAGETIRRPKEAVFEERDRVTAEYRALIPTEEDAAGFDGLIRMTRALAPASEDHNFYHGSLFHSLYDRKMRQLGGLLTRMGILGEPEDVFLLKRGELDSAVWETYTAWARGRVPAGHYHWPETLKRRKEIMERFEGWEGPPALGTVPEVIRSPFAIVHFGITRERIDSWLAGGEASGEDRNRLEGFPASSGVVEGLARVCMTVHDIASLQPGEIMVTQSTAPTWAPAFQLAAGCVTNVGGVFCHAAIVAREYDLPTVVGTAYATARIATGDRIRVDGNEGTVEVLERAG